MLQIYAVMDGEKQIAVELTNGDKTWFYDLDQALWPGLRIGKCPRKSLDEDFTRRLVYTTGQIGPEDNMHVHTWRTRYLEYEPNKSFASGMECSCGAVLSQDEVEEILNEREKVARVDESLEVHPK